MIWYDIISKNKWYFQGLVKCNFQKFVSGKRKPTYGGKHTKDHNDVKHDDKHLIFDFLTSLFSLVANGVSLENFRLNNKNKFLSFFSKNCGR
jgi:hypothetical protein